ncbi:MAG TPA: MFS transporter [Candidatus Dormibacteraeota bacterium]|nr:MFS transporter [Candidatus Dormibacteraeota bacterium]
MTTGVAVMARVPATRWMVLGSYALLAACTQLLWLTFAAVDTRTAASMHVSVGLVGDLAAVFPFVYIVLALPTGRWLDISFSQALGAGAGLTAAGALVRLVAPDSFSWQLAGQFVISAGQPLVLNSINKVAARYFAPAERSVAISIGTAALFVGILASVLMAALALDAGGLPLLLGIQAALSVVAAVLVLVAVRVPASFPDDPSAAVSLRWLLHDRFMWLLAGLVLVGMGAYNAVATWLQPILSLYGEGDSAGYLIAVLTFAGVLGAAVLPTAAARRDRRRTLLIAALFVAAAAFIATAVIHNVVWLGVVLFAAGFVLLAALPVVLDWSGIHAGSERQGSAVGFLMMAGNLGGLLLVLVVQPFIDNGYLALGVLAVAMLLALPVALRLPSRTIA